MSDKLFNREAEKVVLSRLIQNPSIRPELRINPDDMSPDVNRVVFSAADACIASESGLSIHTLTDRLNSYGVKLGGVLDPIVYLNSLVLIQVTDEGAIGMAKRVWHMSLQRKLHKMGGEIQKLAEKGGDLKATELVDQANAVFHNEINLLEGSKDQEPVDLYKSMRDFVETESDCDRGSLISPFPVYNDMYGWFDPGNLFIWVARFKVGKSSFSMSMFQQMAMMPENEDMRALVLDTEMSRDEVQSRILASMTGVKEFYIRHKLYNKPKYQHFRPKIEEALDKMTPLWNKIEHIYIGGWSLEAQLSAARRWGHKTLRGSKRGMLALDYMKMNSSADFSSRTSRDILLGGKTDAYKNLVKKELRVPMALYCQANREGEDSKQGTRLSNGTVIAGSDMIGAFGSNIFLLERLTPEERAYLGQTDNIEYPATHACKLIAPRQLGPNELGKMGLVKYTEKNPRTNKAVDRWCENYLLFSFQDFVFREKGTFRDLVDRAKVLEVPVQDGVAQGPML